MMSSTTSNCSGLLVNNASVYDLSFLLLSLLSERKKKGGGARLLFILVRLYEINFSVVAGVQRILLFSCMLQKVLVKNLCSSINSARKLIIFVKKLCTLRSSLIIFDNL